MSSDQGSNASLTGKSLIGGPEGVHLDVPGFEFELEENLSEESTEQPETPVMPRFEEYRHPNIKLFVMTMAILCNVAIYIQGIRNIPRQYSTVVCSLFPLDDCLIDESPSHRQFIEFFIRVFMELLIPFTLVSVFVVIHLAISVAPGLAVRFQNPLPALLPMIYVTCFFYLITSFLASLSMLPFLASSSRYSVWMDYISNSVLGIFWMYSLLNMLCFSQLIKYNFIRAREKHYMRNAFEGP
ncbi:unnamed protein product [Caenorhabditis sp. 36 PRJEB53466]|nr:unnamed protein product [Caenorhabditis sp. 36 PRJEB53466]